MSLSTRITKKCAVCGMESEQYVLFSTNTFGGGPDLDLRPPEMMRSTMCYWVQECPHCGYVAKTLTDKTGVTIEWLKSDEYTQCSGLHFSNTLAERFYKQYLIAKADENPEGAFYAALHAAWGCDDAQDTESAALCRRLAINEIDAVIQKQPEFFDLNIQKIDLLRRVGMFDEAIAEGRRLSTDKALFQKIIAFELLLAQAKDTKCYTVKDIEKEQ